MSIRQKTWYPILYMFVAMAFFSAILVGFGRFTQERVQANARLAIEKAVLRVLPVALPANASNLELHQLFEKRVKATRRIGKAELPFEVYELEEGGKPVAYAVPIEGQGFWDRIGGVVGVKADGVSIVGIAFYEQKETPGLGAEISKPRFQGQFRSGKRITATGEPLAFVPEGTKTGPGEVNAVTGATQTCTRLARFMNERLEAWRAALARAGELK